MKKVIYIGGSGKLATYIEKNTNYIVSKRNKTHPYYLDLNDLENSILINEKKCLFVIGAAISEPTKCENNPDLCIKINYLKTLELIDKLLQENKVLFLSSDLVFEGNDMTLPNYENSKTNPNHLYSKLKVDIEEKFKDHKNFYFCRLSYILFKENSFTNYLNSCSVEQQTPEIIHPLIRHATAPKEIIKYIELIKKGDREIPQIKHISGKALSRVDMYLKWQDENKVHTDYKTIHISETQMKNYPDYINFDSNYK